MVTPQAAIMVMDHVPSEEEIEDLAEHHLEEFPAINAHATVNIVYEPPAWLAVHERDQMSAHLRDGGACILVIYMQEADLDDEDFYSDDDDDF